MSDHEAKAREIWSLAKLPMSDVKRESLFAQALREAEAAGMERAAGIAENEELTGDVPAGLTTEEFMAIIATMCVTKHSIAAAIRAAKEEA